MERLEAMKAQLMSAIEGQMYDLRSADCDELGKAIDMLKDIEEAMYYCTITESMKENKKSNGEVMYYTEPGRYYGDRNTTYPSTRGTGMGGGYDRGSGSGGYSGRSPDSRRMYMESKEMHHDTSVKMKELESYMKDLTKDLVEMIDDASPEERQLLQQKLTVLSNKIAQTNV